MTRLDERHSEIGGERGLPFAPEGDEREDVRTALLFAHYFVPCDREDGSPGITTDEFGGGVFDDTSDVLLESGIPNQPAKVVCREIRNA